MSIKKILIVVDVQNCFINGGSLGNENIKDNLVQIEEIYKLMGKNDYIYLSRDYHPINHISLVNPMEGREEPNYQSIFPRHCRNPNSRCNARIINNKKTLIDTNNEINTEQNKSIKFINDSITNIKLDSIISRTRVIGTDISYLYFDKQFENKYNTYQYILKKCLTDYILHDPVPIIGLGDPHINCSYKPNINNIYYKKEFTSFNDDDNKKNIIQLTKGEFCDYESYSAFNYHIHFDNKNNIPLEANVANSTGLWEHIIEYVIKNNINTTLEITVCGLVGNICVMNTVHHGINLWNNIYRKTCPNVQIKFIYSFPGTLFLTNALPFSLVKANYQNLTEIIESSIFNNFKIDFKTVTGKEITDTIPNITLEYLIDNNNYRYIDSKLVKIEPAFKGGSDYKQKYLKYKYKYLQLKKNSYN